MCVCVCVGECLCLEAVVRGILYIFAIGFTSSSSSSSTSTRMNFEIQWIEKHSIDLRLKNCDYRIFFKILNWQIHIYFNSFWIRTHCTFTHLYGMCNRDALQFRNSVNRSVCHVLCVHCSHSRRACKFSWRKLVQYLIIKSIKKEQKHFVLNHKSN